ncbi:MAG: murein biosynthesis integral membrane protein MurJ [Eggerthellaceae bacterium]
MANDSSDSIIKNTGLITLCTLGSRVTGLLRTWAMAFALGNTLLTSAYQIAYNMPAMIYELAASGVLATAFLPLYLLQKEKHGDSEAHNFASNILSMTIVILGLLALACSVFSPAVIETQTFTISDGDSKTLAIFFFRIFAVQILLYGVGAVITGILNAERTYLMPSLAPVINNIVVTIVMFAFVPLSAWNQEFALWWLAIGTSVGVLFQFSIQLPALIKQGFRYRPHINLRDPMIVEALKVAAPMFLYIAGTMITFSCRNAFSLEAAPNGPSTLNYAWTWYQLPYGVIAVSLSTTLLTELSDCAAREDWKGFRGFIRSGLRSTFFLIIPLALLVGALAQPLMQLFQAGAFTADEVNNVGSILALWVISLPFYAGYMYMYRVFAALRSFMKFALIDFIIRLVQVAGYWYLCQPEVLGLAGIPIADLAFYVVMFVVCSFIIRSKVGSYGNRGIVGMFVKTTIAGAAGAVIAGVVALGITNAFDTFALNAILEAIIVLVIAGVIGLVVSFGLCKLLRVKEFELLARIGRKIFGRFLPKRGKHAR